MPAIEEIDERIDSLNDQLADAHRLRDDAARTITTLCADLQRQEVDALTTTGQRLNDASDELRARIAEAEATETKLAQHVELLDSALERLYDERRALEPTDEDRRAYYEDVVDGCEIRLAKALGEYLTAFAKLHGVPVGNLDTRKLILRLRDNPAFKRSEQATLEGAPQ